MRRSYLIWTVSLGLLLTVACGGGSGGGSTPIGGGTGGSTNLVLSFQPAQTNPGPKTISMAEVPGPADDQVVVRVSVTDTADVFGAAFDLLFDAAQVEFVQWTAGSLFESAGTAIYQVTEVVPGQLVFGISCAGCSGGVDVSGSNPLIDLVFRVRDANTTGSSLSIAAESLLDSQPPEPGAIAGLSWFGGQLVAN